MRSTFIGRRSSSSRSCYSLASSRRCAAAACPGWCGGVPSALGFHCFLLLRAGATQCCASPTICCPRHAVHYQLHAARHLIRTRSSTHGSRATHSDGVGARSWCRARWSIPTSRSSPRSAFSRCRATRSRTCHPQLSRAGVDYRTATECRLLPPCDTSPAAARGLLTSPQPLRNH